MDTSHATDAPDFPDTPGYPTGGKRLGPAWTQAWAALSLVCRSADPFLDGTLLATQVAEDHRLSPQTLLGVFSRAVAAKVLTREYRRVETDRGPRERAFYRIHGSHLGCP